MFILIICNGNSGSVSPFVSEQANALRKLGHEIIVEPLIGKGIIGYLHKLSSIKKLIYQYSPDVVHAHYGLTGFIACMQKIKPVIITFHGSDAYLPHIRVLSQLAARRSIFNIFVELKIRKLIGVNSPNAIIPCGVDIDTFYPLTQSVARSKLHLIPDKKYILFSSWFDNPSKNYELAINSIRHTNCNVEFIELKGKSREEVNLYLNASNLLLLTSKSEGSPQIIKEGMACNCPIVSTDVGDVREIIAGIEGCYVTSFQKDDIANNIIRALKFSEHIGRTKGRDRIIKLRLDSKTIAGKISKVYQEYNANIENS